MPSRAQTASPSGKRETKNLKPQNYSATYFRVEHLIALGKPPLTKLSTGGLKSLISTLQRVIYVSVNMSVQAAKKCKSNLQKYLPFPIGYILTP